MDAHRFKILSDRLLQRHYAIGLNDTNLVQRGVVEGYIANGEEPFQAVNDHAIKFDLTRVDKHDTMGRRAGILLTKEDQRSALESLSGTSPLKVRPISTSPGMQSNGI